MPGFLLASSAADKRANDASDAAVPRRMMFLRVKLLMVLTMNFLIRVAAMGKFVGNK